MFDIIALFAAFVFVLATSLAVALVLIAERRQRQLAQAQRKARFRSESAYLDSYIRRLGQAATDADLNRLEAERKSQKWDGLSSPSSYG